MRLIVSETQGQSSCTVIHKHSYSTADGLHRENSLYVIVFEWVSGARAEQTPGLIIRSKHTLITVSLPADALIWHWYKHTSTPLQLPVTASTHTLFYTTLDNNNQIGLDDQDTTGLCQCQGQGQGFFICHMINYTGYNQKWNVGQIRSAQWTVQRIKKIKIKK